MEHAQITIRPLSRASQITGQAVHRHVINVFFCFISALVFIPFLLVVISSFSDEQSIIHNGYRFIPERWSIEGYKLVFQSPTLLLKAYGITIVITAIGTIAGLLLTAMTGWVLSRRDYRYNRQATFYVFFTMLFSGGLVPFYILMTQYLHLKDSLLAVIIPGLLNPFYIMIMKGFLSKLPYEMIESAKVDGASEIRIFFTMVLPLSTPALATLGLTISFNYWNEWFNAMLFIDKPNLVTLQLLLVRMLSTIEYLTSNAEFVKQLNIQSAELPKYSVRMAMAILAAGPMLCVFPMFQRYFVAGLTLGSLKG
ncbi:carbohydrate ABC transporter permease [Paenibacillus lignilyticus]|uniref:Carbohydrate ABC transporter permease n=1 Tax=Paenibacillus lignilyticus TaxID=1172615 RepID=A0ABS5C5C4_9BACL|nr:carbohydrate ABC transporter permease [Paenibacillus lignilyticus]MBP3961193.1 carbohydrate ABC transporter permease [Paenibacillus lignilyticus]